VVLDRLLAAWFDEAALIPGLLPDGLGPYATWPHQWFWDGHEHVDPAKEAGAQAVRLANHTTTLADEYARRGLDWETQLRQRAKELALMAELGLSVPAAALTSDDETDDEDSTSDEPAKASAA
jgi:capsid protein